MTTLVLSSDAPVMPGPRTLSHFLLVATGQYVARHPFGESDTLRLDCLSVIDVPIRELVAGAPDTTP
jgi:hypothetical protein